MWRWALPVLVTGSPLKLCVLVASSAPQRTLPLQLVWPHGPSAQQRMPWPHWSQQWCMLPWGRSGGRLRPSLIAWRYQGGVHYASILMSRLHSTVYLFFSTPTFSNFLHLYSNFPASVSPVSGIGGIPLEQKLWLRERPWVWRVWKASVKDRGLDEDMFLLTTKVVPTGEICHWAVKLSNNKWLSAKCVCISHGYVTHSRPLSTMM